MSHDPESKATTVLLSFSSAYGALAQRVAGDLQGAGLAVRFDVWEGGGGVPAFQRVPADLNQVRFVLPLLTPSAVAPTWLGQEWQHAIYAVAHAKQLDILPVHGDGDLAAVPAFLRHLSFADLRGRDARHELRRLLQTLRDRSGDAAIQLPADATHTGGLHSPLAAMARPVVLELGRLLAFQAEGGTALSAFTDESIPFMVDGLFHELGVHVPAVAWRLSDDLPPLGARVLINDVPELQFEVQRDAVAVNESAENLARWGIAGVAEVNPATGAPMAWVPEDRQADVEAQGLTTWTTHGFLILALSAVLRRKAPDFLGVDEAMALVGLIEPAFPCLVAETVPQVVSPFVLTDVLRRLLAEGVGIRNLRCILMAVAHWGRIEQDPLLLTEYARAGLKRQISHQRSRGSNQLVVFLLDPEIERQVREAMTHTHQGSYLAMPPALLRAILSAIEEANSLVRAGAQVPQILTTLEIRSSIRRLVAPTMPWLHAVSYQELRDDIQIQPIGRISLQGFSRRPGVSMGGVPLWS
jgi:type III secretory pathway component EscV